MTSQNSTIFTNTGFSKPHDSCICMAHVFYKHKVNKQMDTPVYSIKHASASASST